MKGGISVPQSAAPRAIAEEEVPRRRTAAHDGAQFIELPVPEYDLAATLNSGQAFRWEACGSGWVGVIGRRWVRLEQHGQRLRAWTAEDPGDWGWLRHYLQLDTDISAVVGAFPADPVMARAVKACRGLRLLRQEPWECLASFVLSSTKQIVQIRQIIRAVCQCFGDPIKVPSGQAPVHAFPSARRLADESESVLRACKMGFRAPYLLGIARAVADGEIDLESLRRLDARTARESLMQLPGVGGKIADCVLLFAYGFAEAFPIDVWVRRALCELYFPGERKHPREIEAFAASYFAPHAGYAQQYLFHYMRGRAGRLERWISSPATSFSDAA